MPAGGIRVCILASRHFLQVPYGGVVVEPPNGDGILCTPQVKSCLRQPPMADIVRAGAVKSAEPMP